MPAERLLRVLALSSIVGGAQADPAVDAGAELPAAFFEFLADWQDHDGAIVEPEMLELPPPPAHDSDEEAGDEQ